MQTLPALARLYCSEEFTQGLDKQIICFSVINAVLAITALVGNTVVLIALHKETSLHRPSKTLLQNLVASDLCVGFTQLTLVSNCISILRKQWRICLLLLSCSSHDRGHLHFSFVIHAGRYKRGQTFSSVVRTKVQTSCNSQTSLFSCYRNLDFNRCWHGHSYNVESRCRSGSWTIMYTSGFDDIHLLLHQNFLHVA